MTSLDFYKADHLFSREETDTREVKEASRSHSHMVIEAGFEAKFGNLLFGPWPPAARGLQPVHGSWLSKCPCSQLALTQISLDSGYACGIPRHPGSRPWGAVKVSNVQVSLIALLLQSALGT